MCCFQIITVFAVEIVPAGTCHVYVKPSDYDKLKAKEDEEIDTLESLALEPNQYSRLGCQVEFKKEYDNMTVTIAHD